MFDFIRSHKRWMHVLLLVLIVPSFLFFGLEGYSRYVDDQSVLAKVDGQPITEPVLEQAQRQRAQQLQQMLGDQFDPRMVNTPQARAALLDELIEARALQVQSRKSYLLASDAFVRKTIADIPAVQQDGKFDPRRYREALATLGLTPASFEAQLRQDLAAQRVIDPLISSVYIPETVLRRIAIDQAQKRTVRGVFITPATPDPSAVSAAQIQAAYAQNRARYTVPESVDIQYVVFDESSFAARHAPTAAEVEAVYRNHPERYTSAEQRHARHILIKYLTPADEAARKKSKARAQAVLDQVRKAPDRFAVIARESSDDPGSAQQGGDLDWFGKGAMVKPFEDAVFAMGKDEISDLVESEFGLHIIQLLDIRPATARPLEMVRSEIETQLRQEWARKQFTEGVDVFNNLLYEQAESLQPVIERFGLTPRRQTNLTRTALPRSGLKQEGDELLSLPALREAIFSDDVLRKQHNTQAIEAGKGRLIAARVTRHTPSRVKSLNEVSDELRDELAGQAVKKDVRARAEVIFKNVQRNQPLPQPWQLSEPVVLSRSAASNDLPAEVIQAVFKAPAGTLPSAVLADAGARGVWVGQIIKTQAPETSAVDTALTAVRGQYGQEWTQALRDVLIHDIRAQTKIVLKEPKPKSSNEPAQP